MHLVFAATLLDEVVAYTKMFSKKIGHHFTSKTIRLTAMTGSAATEIGGTTTASEFNYMRKSSVAREGDIEDFADTRLNIIDEISFANYKTLENISNNLKSFTQCQTYTYGSQAICFLGDFCQLECLAGDVIYKYRPGIFWEQSLTWMVELQGTHRYSKCPVMQDIMPRMRNGELTEQDRQNLNSRVIDGTNVRMPNPSTTRFATFCNQARSEINGYAFKTYLQQYHRGSTENQICNTALVIKAEAHWVSGVSKNKKFSFTQRKILFENCSEADIKNSNSQRCDPLLCLFDGCSLMGNENKDVQNGIANGTTSIFKKAQLKPGAKLHPIKLHGFWVNAVSVDDVEYLLLQWQDSSRFVGTFRIVPSKGVFSVKYPLMEAGITTTPEVSVRLTQFPVVINHATTVHKLQGKSLEALAIAEWSKEKKLGIRCYFKSPFSQRTVFF
jgi:hypothetical protein